MQGVQGLAVWQKACKLQLWFLRAYTESEDSIPGFWDRPPSTHTGHIRSPCGMWTLWTPFQTQTHSLLSCGHRHRAKREKGLVKRERVRLQSHEKLRLHGTEVVTLS
jgi:hypothetical protein